MQHVALGTSDLQATRIAYGCMPLGGSWDEKPLTDEVRDKAFAALDQAMACNINFFDHADIYCKGKSETVFGEWLQQHKTERENIIIQSKCGICFPTDTSPQQFNFSYEHITSSVEKILKRLQCEYLDVLLLHRPDPLMEPDEVARAFSDLKISGKVNWFGVSNQSPAKMSLLQSALDVPLICNQMQISLMHHDLISSGVDYNIKGRHFADDGNLDYCNQHKICVQAWSPLARGFLSGLEVDDNNPHYEYITKIQDEIKILANKYDTTMAAISLAWLMRLPCQVQPVIGTTNPQRIKDAVAADHIDLSRDDWYRLYHAAREHRLP